MFKSIGFLVTLGAIVFVVGLVLDWWSFSRTTTPDGTTITVRSDDRRVKEAVDGARRALGDGVNEAEDLVKGLGRETCEGRIVEVSTARLILVGPDGAKKTFSLASDLDVEIDGAAAKPSALRDGDQVKVVYEEQADGPVAFALRVTRTS